MVCRGILDAAACTVVTAWLPTGERLVIAV
jgi:hypothetical protein